MAFQSVWYFTDLPEEIVNIIEKDLFDSFGERMSDSKIQGDSLNKEKKKFKECMGSYYTLGSRIYLALHNESKS